MYLGTALSINGLWGTNRPHGRRAHLVTQQERLPGLVKHSHVAAFGRHFHQTASTALGEAPPNLVLGYMSAQSGTYDIKTVWEGQ